MKIYGKNVRVQSRAPLSVSLRSPSLRPDPLHFVPTPKFLLLPPSCPPSLLPFKNHPDDFAALAAPLSHVSILAT